MYLNSFSLRVIGGAEQPGGYVEMEHGTQYRLCLHNHRGQRADARVEIDGKHVGTWRLEARQSVTLERPAHDAGCFTFYRLGTPEADLAALNPADPSVGLVRVTFTPETLTAVRVLRNPNFRATSVPCSGNGVPVMDFVQLTGTVTAYHASARSYQAGGTGLSGQSGQVFGTAGPIEYDLAQQTVIHLRLVAGSAPEGARPLTCYSTPIPPAVR